MRIVIDTNVLISACLKASSWPGRVVRWVDAFGGLLKTRATEREALLVLERPRIAARVDPLFAARLRTMLGDAELVVISERVAACRDPKDDKFLELAVNGRADAVVSGDEDLLVLDPFRGIPIITAAAFGHARAA